MERATPAEHRLREYVFPSVLGLVIIAVGSLPYLYGYATAPPGQRFMGFVGRGTPGANGYLMLARQARDGAHLMENKVTPEPLPRTYFNLEWWLFGKASRWTGLSLMAVFHVGRALTVLGFCLAVYYLAALCLGSVFERRLAVLLICLGSGFGWILWCANHGLGLWLIPSRDLNGVSVPGYLINKPHFIRAGIFAALKYAFLLAGARSGKRRYFVLSGLSALAHSSIRPYHIPETYLVYALFPVLLNWREGRWSWGRFKNYALAGAVHLPAVAFFGYLAVAQTLGMSGWERKPGFLIEYVLWLGWPFLLFCVALPWYLRVREAHDATLLLTLWIVLAWLICNAYPYWGAGQEAAFYSFHIVPPILAVAGPLRWAREWLEKRRGHPLVLPPLGSAAVAAVLVVVSMPSTALVYAEMSSRLHTGHREWTYHLSEDTYQALCWLEEHGEPNTVVLASHDTSQFVPRIARNKVVTGHDMLTANYRQKNEWVRRFYGEANDGAFKRDLVARYAIRYVVYGPRERALGMADPAGLPWLRCVFRQGEAAVYEVGG